MSLPTYFRRNVTLEMVKDAIRNIDQKLKEEYPRGACHCIDRVIAVEDRHSRKAMLANFTGFTPVTYSNSDIPTAYFISADDLNDLLKWWDSMDPSGWLEPAMKAFDAVRYLSEDRPNTDISPAALEQAKIYVERRKLLLRHFRSLMELAIEQLRK